VGVPRGADDPQGPNRPGAGGSARPSPGRGSWGLSFSGSGHPHRAPAPGSAIFQGGTRQQHPPSRFPTGHRSSSSAPTHLSALLAVELAVGRCPPHGRFGACRGPSRFCRAGTASAGWQPPGQGWPPDRPRGLEVLVAEEPRGSGCLERRGDRGCLAVRACLAWAGATGDSCTVLRRSPWLLFGKVGAWLRHRSDRLIR
jgi:hypothetical protein